MTINDNNIVPFSKYILERFQEHDTFPHSLRLQRTLYRIFQEIGYDPVVNYEKRSWGPCFYPVYDHFCGYGVMPIYLVESTRSTKQDYESFNLTVKELETINKIILEEVSKDDITSVVDFNKEFGF